MLVRTALILLWLGLASAESNGSSSCKDAEGCALEQSVLLHLQTKKKQARSKVLKTFAGTSMYFLLVDRFGRTDGKLKPCASTNDPIENNGWCGGTLKGITAHLDYIAELGFDCIWLTPIIKQYPGTTPSGTGSMGYWARDIYQIEENYGTPEDFHELIAKAHEKGLCVVQDFVANHMGPIHSTKDVEQMNPFNKPEYFHQLYRGNMTFDEYVKKDKAWPPPAQAMWSQSGAQCTQGQSCHCWKVEGDYGPFGPIPYDAKRVWNPDSPCAPGMLSDFCKPGDYACEGYNETVTEQGWFYDLGDLDQDNAFVRAEQLKWVKWYASTYDIDAYRLDTAAFMDFDFLSELQEAAGIPIIGEVTATNLTYHAQFEANPPPKGRAVLDGVLNFPTHFTAQAAFCKSWFPYSQANLSFLANRMMAQIESGLYKSVDTLGNFADNHDVERAIHLCEGDRSKATNFFAWVMLTKGVPIIYYGTEQYFELQRESFWQTGYDTSTFMFKWLKSLNLLRKEDNLATSDMVVKASSPEKLIFTRGGDQGVWVFLNNLDNTTEGSVSYCDAVPGEAASNTSWVEATSGMKAEIENGCFVATDTYPKVLVQRAV